MRWIQFVQKNFGLRPIVSKSFLSLNSTTFMASILSFPVFYFSFLNIFVKKIPLENHINSQSNLDQNLTILKENSLLKYSEMKVLIETAFGDGERKRTAEIIIDGYNEGFTVEQLSKLTKLSVIEIEKIISSSK